jgi:hypothetical protein
MKTLVIGMLLASPPVAAWILHAAEPTVPQTENQSLVIPESPPAIQIPVEIVAKGSANQVVYVEVSNQAIPEPGVPALMALASLLLLRRQRPEGK